MNGVNVTFMYCEVIAVVTQSSPSHFGNNKNNKILARLHTTCQRKNANKRVGERVGEELVAKWQCVFRGLSDDSGQGKLIFAQRKVYSKQQNDIRTTRAGNKSAEK